MNIEIMVATYISTLMYEGLLQNAGAIVECSFPEHSPLKTVFH